MRLKRPRPASPDQVRIIREGETAVIEYAGCPSYKFRPAQKSGPFRVI